MEMAMNLAKNTQAGYFAFDLMIGYGLIALGIILFLIAITHPWSIVSWWSLATMLCIIIGIAWEVTGWLST